jgi:hypothetical protein
MTLAENPIACKKSKIYAELYRLPTTSVRKTINRIVSENRGITIEEAKPKISLRKNEVILIMKELGEID